MSHLVGSLAARYGRIEGWDDKIFGTPDDPNDVYMPGYEIPLPRPSENVLIPWKPNNGRTVGKLWNPLSEYPREVIDIPEEKKTWLEWLYLTWLFQGESKKRVPKQKTGTTVQTTQTKKKKVVQVKPPSPSIGKLTKTSTKKVVEVETLNTTQPTQSKLGWGLFNWLFAKNKQQPQTANETATNVQATEKVQPTQTGTKTWFKWPWATSEKSKPTQTRPRKVHFVDADDLVAEEQQEDLANEVETASEEDQIAAEKTPSPTEEPVEDWFWEQELEAAVDRERLEKQQTSGEQSTPEDQNIIAEVDRGIVQAVMKSFELFFKALGEILRNFWTFLKWAILCAVVLFLITPRFFGFLEWLIFTGPTGHIKQPTSTGHSIPSTAGRFPGVIGRQTTTSRPELQWEGVNTDSGW